MISPDPGLGANARRTPSNRRPKSFVVLVNVCENKSCTDHAAPEAAAQSEQPSAATTFAMQSISNVYQAGWLWPLVDPIPERK